jgi:hypothetical protein
MVDIQHLPNSVAEALARYDTAIVDYAHIENPMRALDNEEVLNEYKAARAALIEILEQVT